MPSSVEKMKKIVLLQLMLTWVTCKSPLVPNESKSSQPEEIWKPVTRSHVINPSKVKWFAAVTINPRKSRKYVRRHRQNPRRKRQRKFTFPTDDQIEIPEVSQGAYLLS